MDLSQIFLKNLNFFKKNHPDIFIQFSLTQENQQYDLIIDDQGFFNIEFLQTSEKIFSQDPQQLAKLEVLNTLNDISNPKKIIFIGSMLGFQIEEMLLKTDSKCIMIIEPNIELFKLSAFLIDYEILTRNKFTIFAISLDEKELENRILEFIYTMYYDNDEIAFLNSVPAYHQIFETIGSTYKNNIRYQPEPIKRTTKSYKTLNLPTIFRQAQTESQQNHTSKALECYRKIADFEPFIAHSENANQELIILSYLYMGHIFINGRHFSEALHCYGKCIFTPGISKDIYETALNYYLEVSSHWNHLNKKSISLLEAYFKHPSKNTNLVVKYGDYLYSINQREKARAFLEPYKELLVKDYKIIALLEPLSPIHFSQEEIDLERQKLENDLDALLESDIQIPEEKLTVYDSFYLAYHNRNNKNILTKLSLFYRKATPKINFVSDHCKSYTFKGKKIKLGFISSNLLPGHPVLKFMKNIIDSFIHNPLYHVEIFTLSKATKQVFQHNVNVLTGTLQNQRELIAKQKLDILMYPDIGMHPGVYILAHARLAHIQGVFGGHPVTSGISTIDYFFSNKNLEAQNAQEYYTEELLLFENLVGHYDKSKIPETFLTKEELGLSYTKHNYIIPSKLQKIHPELDGLLHDILKKDDKAVFIFFKDAAENMWDSAIKERLTKLLDEEHIKFIPWAKSEVFLSYLHHADAVLEPVNFGFGTTAIEAFSVGTPIVTYPKELMYSRVTYWYYKQMGINDFYAKNATEYVDLAIKLASDTNYKESISSEILERNSVLYENSGAYHELDNFFKNKLGVLS